MLVLAKFIDEFKTLKNLSSANTKKTCCNSKSRFEIILKEMILNQVTTLMDPLCKRLHSAQMEPGRGAICKDCKAIPKAIARR